jgi:hypothetical protein
MVAVARFNYGALYRGMDLTWTPWPPVWPRPTGWPIPLAWADEPLCRGWDYMDVTSPITAQPGGLCASARDCLIRTARNELAPPRLLRDVRTRCWSFHCRAYLPVIADFDAQLYAEGCRFVAGELRDNYVAAVRNLPAQGMIWAGGDSRAAARSPQPIITIAHRWPGNAIWIGGCSRRNSPTRPVSQTSTIFTRPATC